MTPSSGSSTASLMTSSSAGLGAGFAFGAGTVVVGDSYAPPIPRSVARDCHVATERDEYSATGRRVRILRRAVRGEGAEPADRCAFRGAGRCLGETSGARAAQVRDDSGQVLCQTPSITFYVQQPNLFSPGATNGAPAVPGTPHPR